jgi:hypothetical protein
MFVPGPVSTHVAFVTQPPLAVRQLLIEEQ